MTDAEIDALSQESYYECHPGCSHCCAVWAREIAIHKWRQLVFLLLDRPRLPWINFVVYWRPEGKIINPCFQFTHGHWTLYADVAIPLSIDGIRWMREVERRQDVRLFRL